MKLIFGLALDGWTPNSGNLPPDHYYCGLAGLLRTLELRLGLPTPENSKARRVVAYQSALQAAATTDRFYSASFGKDPLGTATALLDWRDELKLAGWAGQTLSSPRLAALAAVEAVLDPTAATSEGDRIHAICAEMANRDPQLESVEVVEAAAHLPFALRGLLDRLNARYDQRPLTPQAPAASDLGQLQAALLSKSHAKLNWQKDGSVRLFGAFSEITLANHAAHVLKANRASNVASTVVATALARPLEAALLALDEPAPAVASRSIHRAVLQVLPLALRLRWAPLDPQHLIEFLAHPVGPVRPSLRRRLAQVVANYPGVGSPAWVSAIAEYRTGLEQTHAADPAALKVALARLESDVQDWLTPTRVDRNLAVVGSELASTCDQVADWASSQMGGTKDPLLLTQYKVAVAQAQELGFLLRSLPTVTLIQLELLSEQLQGNGLGSGMTQAEVGSVLVRQPAAMLALAEAVLWWGFEATPTPTGAPWTPAEVKVLAEAGAVVLPMATRLALFNAAALRPILAAKTTVSLYLPYTRGTESVAHHPLHDHLDALIEDKLPIEHLDGQLEAGTLPATVPVPFQPLPELRRWWHTAPASIPTRTEESFSSAEAFIYQPFSWVLNYQAKLRKGALAQFELLADSRQRGTLLHRVTEFLFGPDPGLAWLTMTQVEFENWLDALWPKLLETEGANLLLPGNRADGLRLALQAKQAIWQLVEALKAAKVVSATVNISLDGVQFIGGALGGKLDLEVVNASGQRAVIDLKYGSKTYRVNQLAKNLHLQLTIYGKLRAKTMGGAWPETAYFILNPPTLLALDKTFFPTAQVVTTKVANPGVQTCWAEFEQVWGWRRGLLDQGWIELPLKGTTPSDGTGTDPASTPPLLAWLHEPEDSTRYDEFTALTGWEASK